MHQPHKGCSAPFANIRGQGRNIDNRYIQSLFIFSAPIDLYGPFGRNHFINHTRDVPPLLQIYGRRVGILTIATFISSSFFPPQSIYMALMVGIPPSATQVRNYPVTCDLPLLLYFLQMHFLQRCLLQIYFRITFFRIVFSEERSAQRTQQFFFSLGGGS